MQLLSLGQPQPLINVGATATASHVTIRRIRTLATVRGLVQVQATATNVNISYNPTEVSVTSAYPAVRVINGSAVGWRAILDESERLISTDASSVGYRDPPRLQPGDANALPDHQLGPGVDDGR